MTHSGGRPHAVGDRGQRYEVTFLDPEINERRILGWAETPEGARDFVRCVELHPSWHSPEILDRNPPPPPPPVDRSQTTLMDGSPVTDDHRELKPNGQQKGYVVLSAEERAKGFVRPVRNSYQHVGLPKPWCPDNGISYRRPNYAHEPADHDWPTGTNLFDATQAEAMVRYMLEGMPERPAAPKP